MSLVIVDDLYNNYDLGFEDDGDSLLVFCNICDDIVAEMEWSRVEDLDDMDLYERIIEAHREEV